MIKKNELKTKLVPANIAMSLFMIEAAVKATEDGYKVVFVTKELADRKI
jgi:hypothetical protein